MTTGDFDRYPWLWKPADCRLPQPAGSAVKEERKLNVTIISKDEWKRRYAKALIEGGGLDQATADGAAESAVEHADDWLSPEDSATEEMSYWTNDAVA